MPQRRQGLPRRPKTQWSRPRRGSPVVVCSGWCRLARIRVRARLTSDGAGSGTSATRVQGCTPQQEQRLDLVEVADAGQVPLVDQGDADLLVGERAQPAQRLVEVPVGAEHVRPEMADEPVLLGGGDQRRCRAAGSRRTPTRRWRGPRGPRRPARRCHGVPGPVDVPAAVHPEVRAQGAAVVEPDQQVLAARDAPRATVAPVRSTVASWGIRNSPRRSVAAGQRGAHALAPPARRCLLRAPASVSWPRRMRCGRRGVRPPTSGMTREPPALGGP